MVDFEDKDSLDHKYLTFVSLHGNVLVEVSSEIVKKERDVEFANLVVIDNP